MTDTAKPILTKTTVLDAHYASGDYECFCFDRHYGPEEHEDAILPQRVAFAKWCDENPDSEEVGPDIDESCRVYPNELIPDNSRGKRGRWTITITFEPEGSTEVIRCPNHP